MQNEALIRIGIFLGVLCLIALCEVFFPKRAQNPHRPTRWSRNLSIIALDTVIVRIAVPFTAAGLALWAEGAQFGLLNQIAIPPIVAFILSMVLLDLIIYGQHVAFHHIPALWQLHKIHHIDQEFDVTTGVRFHPIEIVLSTLLKCGAVVLLGVPFMAVVVFEILLNATALFNHGNLRLPKGVEAALRWIVVTPDMHRIHHSVHSVETNSNFGFNLPWWDRLFGTYKADPKDGHRDMRIGLNEYRDMEKTGLAALLILPFQKPKKPDQEPHDT